MMKAKSIVAFAAGAILLMGATAGASVYIMENVVHERPAHIPAKEASTRETVTFNQVLPAPQPVCDDDNIVGKVVGGAAGGIAGSQIGGGTGKTAATIGGAVGGALLGEEYIPTQNITCR